MRGECVLDVRVAWSWVANEEGSRLHDHAVDAVTALHRLLFNECALRSGISGSSNDVVIRAPFTSNVLEIAMGLPSGSTPFAGMDFRRDPALCERAHQR